jgi:hypothetical protein
MQGMKILEEWISKEIDHAIKRKSNYGWKPYERAKDTYEYYLGYIEAMNNVLLKITDIKVNEALRARANRE